MSPQDNKPGQELTGTITELFLSLRPPPRIHRFFSHPLHNALHLGSPATPLDKASAPVVTTCRSCLSLPSTANLGISPCGTARDSESTTLLPLGPLLRIPQLTTTCVKNGNFEWRFHRQCPYQLVFDWPAHRLFQMGGNPEGVMASSDVCLHVRSSRSKLSDYFPTELQEGRLPCRSPSIHNRNAPTS
jgi:hypothetical protein